ncbi:MAG TPA: nucleotidyltransferase family protein [Candidatus Binatia bacterium]
MESTTTAGYALLARSLGADDRLGIIEALARVAPDPDLVPTLRRHHLIPILWTSVPETELRARFPAAAFAHCEAAMRRRRLEPAESLRLLDEVQRALAGAGIECMLLKGAYFAHRLYPAPERRAQHDVDVLVRRRMLAQAGARLAAIGFTTRWRDLHSVTWQRAAMQVDVHACFRNVPVYRLDEERIWRERNAWTIDGVAFTTPSDEDTLVLLALSLFQDLGLGSAKLKQLLDLYLLAAAIDAAFDWPRFLMRRRAEGTLPIVVNVLDLMMRLFDASGALPALACALAACADVAIAAHTDEALALLGADRGAVACKAWFFRVYPGSLARYWLWLLPRKIPAYLRGGAPVRGASAMRPGLDTLRLLLDVRRRRRVPAGS